MGMGNKYGLLLSMALAMSGNQILHEPFPKELDEEFCISEGMAVFEQEEEEDAETEES
jgi:hypothetical protein